MKLSQINGGTSDTYNPATDKLVGIRTVDDETSDRLYDLPPLTADGADAEVEVGIAAGTGAEVTAGKTNAGIITINTGTGTTAGKLCSIIYAVPFANGSSALLMPSNLDAVSLMPSLYTVPTDEGFDIMVSGDDAVDDTTYILSYLVVGF